MGTMRSQRGPKRTSLAERPNDGDRLELLDEGTYFARVDSLVRGEPPLATLDMVSSEGWDPLERGETTLSGAVRAFWRRWEENAVLGVENPLEQFTVRLADVHVDEPRSWDEWFENASWLTVIVRAAHRRPDLVRKLRHRGDGTSCRSGLEQDLQHGSLAQHSGAKGGKSSRIHPPPRPPGGTRRRPRVDKFFVEP